MFSCNRHGKAGFGAFCTECLRELAELHAERAGDEPTATPPAPEWDGEGLPPVGCEVEMSLGFHCGIQAKITYMGDGVFCYRNLRNGGEYTGAISDATFRPLRTKEQMEMEEIKALALSEVADRVSGHHRVESIKQAIAALCDAGMLRKAGDE